MTTLEDLRVIANLVVHLTELRQNEVKHLCIENFAPDLFRDLLIAQAQANNVIKEWEAEC